MTKVLRKDLDNERELYIHIDETGWGNAPEGTIGCKYIAVNGSTDKVIFYTDEKELQKAIQEFEKLESK
jgi:hypothetical protein